MDKSMTVITMRQIRSHEKHFIVFRAEMMLSLFIHHQTTNHISREVLFCRRIATQILWLQEKRRRIKADEVEVG